MQVMSGTEGSVVQEWRRNGRGLALGVIILLRLSGETTPALLDETEKALAAARLFTIQHHIYNVKEGSIVSRSYSESVRSM